MCIRSTKTWVWQVEKHTSWEGGARVPFIIWWPRHVESGRVDEDRVTSFMDWLPTSCFIVGIDQLLEGTDGEDVSDIWQKGPRSRKTPPFWRASMNLGNPVTLRNDNGKFFQLKTGPVLFDVIQDPGERNNLAKQYLEVVAERSAAADAWSDSAPKKYLNQKGRGNSDEE